MLWWTGTLEVKYVNPLPSLKSCNYILLVSQLGVTGSQVQNLLFQHLGAELDPRYALSRGG